jgi:hypothetical protein
VRDRQKLYYRLLRRHGYLWRALWDAACAYAFSHAPLGELRIGMWEERVWKERWERSCPSKGEYEYLSMVK